MMQLAKLPERGVIEVSGSDRLTYLQGLVSNDVEQAAPGSPHGQAVWAALLTPQGKWLADFFILSDGERLLLDCERAQVSMLIQRLGRYRLRSKVQLRDVSSELEIYAGWQGVPDLDVRPGLLVARDPRLTEAGWRIASAGPLTPTATHEAWDRHRLLLGLPDGSRDLEAEKTVLLEAGFDELHGVSWSKGCYMGQELTARTKYRGLVKRRLVPVEVQGLLPPPGSPVLRGSTEVGTVRSGLEGRGLAVLRIDALSAALSSQDATLIPRVPEWMALPEPVG